MFALGLLRVGLVLVCGGIGIGFGVELQGLLSGGGLRWAYLQWLCAGLSADRIIQTHSKPASIQNNTSLVRTEGWFGWG